MTRRHSTTSAVLFSASILLAACGGSSDTTSSGSTPGAAEDPPGVIDDPQTDPDTPTDPVPDTPASPLGMLSDDTAVACAATALKVASSDFGRNYRALFADYYGSDLLERLGEGTESPDSTLDLEIIDYPCTLGGNTQTATIFDTEGAFSATPGFPNVDREYTFSRCAIDGVVIDGMLSTGETDFQTDDESQTLTTESFDLRYTAGLQAETLMAEVSGSVGSYYDESIREDVDSDGQNYTVSMYSFAADGRLPVVITNASGNFFSTEIPSLGESRSDSVLTDFSQDGCYSLPGEDTSRFVAQLSVTTPSAMNIVSGTTDVTAGLVRLEATDGSITEISATDSVSEAQVTVTDTSGNSTSSTVPWSLLLNRL